MSEAINQKPDQHSGQFPVQKSGQRPDEQSDQHSGQLSTQKSDQKHNEKPDEKPAPKPSLKPTPKPTLKPGQNQEPSGHKKRPQKRKPNYEQASFPDWKIEGDLLVAVTPGSLPPGKDWLIWFLVGLLLFLTCVDRWR